MSRYNSLLNIIHLFQPKTIVETGTWKGYNAVRMLTTARMFHERPEYVGYDLFEDGNEETDAEEFNIKERPTLVGAETKIKRKCPFAEVVLVKGNTRDTLAGVQADLAFIDGGHSLETIKHDYESLKHSKIIVFDDFYSADSEGRIPDITKVGCNELIKDLPHMVIPSNDPVATGGIVHLAVVFGV